MLLRSLSHFVALANERDLKRAAKACKVRRSAISASLRELETYLEAPLVNEGGGLLRLTAHGERTLSWARRILAEYENMRSELVDMGYAAHARDPLRKPQCEKR